MRVKEIFRLLYDGIDGNKISHEARSKLPYYYLADTYGEVIFDSFLEILTLAKPKDNEVFYDLGSGTGKPTLIAYLCFNFSKIIGVEKLEDLHTTSNKLLSLLKTNYLQDIKGEIDPIVNFIHSDFKNVDFTDADIIFMNSYTYFYYEINNKYFFNKLLKLKKGSRIITTRMPIFSDLFKVEQKGPYAFSWGEEFIFLHRKLIGPLEN